MFSARRTPLTHPDPVYFEEMRALPFSPEYHVFQDEWSQGILPTKRYPSVDIYRNTGGREISPNAKVNFSKSYQDYALDLMNEWWKRGVSIYWDNTYPYLLTNPRTSAAYKTPDGRVQPGKSYWNQREYMKRTWNLMQYWRRQKTTRPLEFVTHMTNANILPFFSWSTCNYDMELSQSIYAKTHPDHYIPGEPFDPEYLQATSIGRQVGNYPYLVHNIFLGQCHLPGEALGIAREKVEKNRREWGMRMVHEIISGGPQNYHLPSGLLNKSVYQFGYDTDEVQVRNYWDDSPAFTVTDKKVKGLLLTRAKDQKMLLILQSWSKNPLTTQVQFNAESIGFKPGRHAYQGINNRSYSLNDNSLEVKFDFPYETRIYLIDNQSPGKNVLFTDNFDAWCNPGWDYLSHYVSVDQGRLKFERNNAPWRGKPRLFKYLDLPGFKSGELCFSFQLAKKPKDRTDILRASLGNGVAMSKHGLSHSYLKDQISFQLVADPKKGWVWSAFAKLDGKHKHLASSRIGQLDTAAHQVRIILEKTGNGILKFDNQQVFKFTEPESDVKNGFSFVITGDPAKSIDALYLDDITLYSEEADNTILERQRTTAMTRAREIVAARIDELKRQIIAAFGIFGHKPIYNLAMFRQPEADIDDLAQRLKSETSSSRRKVLLAVFRELPKRQKEHVDGMKAIGQPAFRLEEFKRARIKAVKSLQNWQSPVNISDNKTKTINQLQP